MVEFGQVEVFANLSERSRQMLNQGCISNVCAPETVVLHKGDKVSGAYLVIKGRLRVYTLSPSGTEATLYFINPGETCVLALNCLFNDFLYPAWVQAEEATEVILIPGPIYRELFSIEPDFQELTVTALSVAVFRLMAELEQIHSQRHRQRLANFILIHASADGALRMTQQRLANHIGTTREVIARLLGEFSTDGMISTGRGVIRISDIEPLRRVATDTTTKP